MSLLDPDIWTDKVFTGEWRPGRGRREVIEPATGDVLGSVGVADAATVAGATALATQAQREWAARTPYERAAVLKPDPRTSVCGGVLIARLLEAAGVPAGVFHMLPGGAEVGEALIDDPQ